MTVELAGVRNRKALGMSAPEGECGPWMLRSTNGTEGQSFNRTDEFIVALRKAMTEATDIEDLFAIWELNVDAVRAINKHLRRRRRRVSSPKILLLI